MPKVILVTGATDGIGFETAKMLASQGHHVLLHGRNPAKLNNAEEQLNQLPGNAKIETYKADLSKLSEVSLLAKEITAEHSHLDALINNAGIYNAPVATTDDGFDIRYAVNTFAPYLLTKALLPLLKQNARVINLSSAAQATVDLAALAGEKSLSAGDAYAQSKLAITMWSRSMGLALKESGPMIASVNPKSLLGSKMVKSAFGIAGSDLSVGADILVRAALSDEFASAHGLYFDNDIGQFGKPHPDALNDQTVQAVVEAMDSALAKF
ncbi:oxidoreductase [Photobacterium gaetbulicola]|uniref:Oxidoreductase n=1 Tax=Photobacterium gaetbulicola TaxID=1295392 RepID=A0A0B9G533_9GAMM|nr:SDR family NAD(P)-dependent oxidoreductase [Photobacterium gaetbulicola]KHT63689.1 oxidoreductase [Photobacterium gaetbulicola]